MSNFANDLLRQQEKEEMDKFAFVDIETGFCVDHAVIDLQRKRIQKEIQKQKYEYRHDWKPETNKRKADEFELQKPEKIKRMVDKFLDESALNPFTNRICIIGVHHGQNLYQFDELKMHEREMLEQFNRIVHGKTIVSYTQFDVATLRTKMVKYGIERRWNGEIDMAYIAQHWGVYGKVVPSLDLLAVSVGVTQNNIDVDPADIGGIFEKLRMEFDGNLYDKVMEYNAEDIRTLKEIFRMFWKTGFIGG